MSIAKYSANIDISSTSRGSTRQIARARMASDTGTIKRVGKVIAPRSLFMATPLPVP